MSNSPRFYFSNSEIRPRINTSAMLRAFLLVAIATTGALISLGQNIQRPETKSDFTKRSDLRVDPSTLALNIQIPLGNYPGRAGNDFPVALNYTSKLLQIQFLQGPGPEDLYNTWAVPGWSEYAAAGWTPTLGVPFVSGPTSTELYDSAGAPTTSCWPGCKVVRHVQIRMPDGSTHDLRHGAPIANWPAGQPFPNPSGLYYAVDESQLRYDWDSQVLFLPDGSRYFLGNSATKTFVDRNGNTQTYNMQNKTWTDTMGRVIPVPFAVAGQPYGSAPSTAGDVPFTLPGVGGTSLTYIFRWKTLGNSRTNPSIPLLPPCDTANPNNPTGGTPGFSLTYSMWPDSVACGDGIIVFDPIVLAEIILPTGQSYKFTYNSYGEIDKIVYPSGGYERYRYDYIPAADWIRGVYAQTNRGVVERWISPKGDGSDEQHWTYSAAYGPNFSQPYKVTITAPDSTRTERFLHTGVQDYPFQFRDVRSSRAYEERFYSSTNQLLRRTLWKWTASEHFGNANARFAHLDKQVEIIFDTSGNALSQTTLNVYDAAQNLCTVSKYDFYELNQGTAQTIGIDSVPAGTFLQTDETIFLVNDPNIASNIRTLYIDRNLVNLPSTKRIIGPSGDVARNAFLYDEYGFNSSGGTPYWTDPGTAIRGNVTSASQWLNTNNSNLATHAVYDQYGNVKLSWDANDPGFTNPTQIDYSSTYHFAYPTTTTSSIPDTTAVHGSNVALSTSTNFDFTTGAVLSVTDPNNRTTSYTYNDVLQRVKTINSPDGGLTTYNYGDVPGNLYVEKVTKATASDNTQSFQFFDGIGRLNRTFVNVGGGFFITSDTLFDSMNRAWRVSKSYLSTGPGSGINPSGLWTESTYDAQGRILSVSTPDGAVVSTAYDGNRLLVTDQAGKQRMSKTDALGRLKDVWEITAADGATEGISTFLNHSEAANGYRTKYSYDPAGNLTNVTQQVGTGGVTQTRSFVYNSLSQLIDATTPESGHVTYTYEPNGNLQSKTDARWVTINYAYDALNRNISVTTTNDPAGTPTINRYYDGFRDGSNNPALVNAKGRLWQTETSGSGGSRSTITNTDAVGRPTHVSQQFLLNSVWSQPFATQRTYNFAGKVTSQTYPSGRTVSYTYDAAGRVASFSGNIGDGVQRTYATNIAYQESSRLQQEQFGTQTALFHKLHYNIRGQLYDVRLSTYSLQTNEFDWNRGCLAFYYGGAAWGQSSPANNGNLTMFQHWAPLDPGFSNYGYTQDTYSYDNLNRLSSVSEVHGGPWGQSGQDFVQVYDYDRFANRTINQSLTTGAPKPWFTVDAWTNRLTVPGGQTGNIHYDSAGNLDNDSYSSFGSNDGTPTRTYDSENRLVVVRDGNQQVVSVYTYNGDGQRVRRKINNSETWQVYGIDGELLAEYQSGAAPITATKEYGYRNGELLTSVTSGDPQRLTRFIKNLYFNAFAREPSATELQQKMDILAAAGVQGESQLLTSARSVARGMFESSEYIARGRTDPQYVTDLYNAYLQRAPDPPGLNYWVSNTQINGRGATLNAFEVCGEFATLAATVYGTTSAGDNQRVEHFVQMFYLGALQRDPNSTEMQQQTARLNNAAAVSQAQVITEAQTMGGEIFESTNYNSSRTTEQYVTDLYEAFLQRAPDGPGLNFWVNNTNTHGRPATLQAFKVCGEYAELAGTLYREAYWLVADRLGTPRMIVDKTGNLASLKRHDYLPFGEELGLVSGRTTAQGYSQVDNLRQKFTSKERDAETNLDYFGARYYASSQGRFTSVDQGPPELLEPQTWNRYQYARNNPLYYIDADGNKDEPAKDQRVNQALAGDPTLLEVIKASNNFSQRAFEDALNRGEFKGELNTPGGNKLRGLAGEAIVMDDLNRLTDSTLIPMSMLTVSQPGNLSLFGMSSPNISPDIGAIYSNGDLGKVKVTGILRDVVSNSQGATSSMALQPNVKFGLYEVKAGFTSKNFDKGAAQVAATAGLLKASGLPGIAVLAVDKSVFNTLSPQKRAALYNKVTQAGGYIQLYENLAADAETRSRALIREAR